VNGWCLLSPSSRRSRTVRSHEATAFSRLESFEGSEDRDSIAQEFFICSLEPFVVTSKTKEKDVTDAFGRWLDAALASRSRSTVIDCSAGNWEMPVVETEKGAVFDAWAEDLCVHISEPHILRRAAEPGIVRQRPEERMYLLINGAFGVGKSTVAAELRSLLPRFRGLRPGVVGLALLRLSGACVRLSASGFVAAPDRAWREARRFVSLSSHHPDGVSDLEYLDEVRSGLARSGRPFSIFASPRRSKSSREARRAGRARARPTVHLGPPARGRVLRGAPASDFSVRVRPRIGLPPPSRLARGSTSPRAGC